MALPTSLTQLSIYLLLLVPGISFATVRTWLTGQRSTDKSVGSRILEAIFISIVFDTIYGIVVAGAVTAVGATVSNEFVLEHPFVVSLIAALFFLVAPAVVSYFWFGNISWVRVGGARLRVPRLNTRFSNTPTAWDAIAARLPSGRFVRIRTGAGVWVGGWFSTRSFMSTYPESRDLYIEVQYRMSDDGEFEERIANTAGVWVSVDSATIVEWIDFEQPIGGGGDGR